MRALRMAVHAAVASGVMILGASCSADRLTVPGADRAEGLEPAEAAVWGRTRVDVKPDVDTLALGTSRQLTMEVGDARQVNATVHWTSLDSKVVSVNNAGLATAASGGEARVVGKVGPLADTAVVVVSVSVASVVAAPESGELTIGQHAQLGATANDALGRPLSGIDFEWSSLSPSVASVSGAGLVTGVGLGEAKIVARAAGQSDTATVRVTPVAVAAVGVAPSTLALSAGASAQLSAAATSASGEVLGDRLATWTSSDEAVARVSTTGQVSAVGAGSATITATIDGRSASATVNVATAAVASLAVSANATALTVGQTTQVTATVLDGAGAVLGGRAVTWASSSESVATVSSSGVVTAVAAGPVTITGSSEGAKATVTITVTQTAVASVKVSINSPSVSVGQTAQATASAFDAGGQALAGRAVTWSIAPASVATVSTAGIVTGVAAGTATLTATVEGKSSTTSITVTKPAEVLQPPPTGGGLGVIPELPRSVVASSLASTPSAGATINVPAGGNLQVAIDGAKPGDVIVLQSGATFSGNFTLPNKVGGGDGAWVTIRSGTTIGAEGVRVTPSSASAFAKIVTPNSQPAIATDHGAHHYRLMGLEITAGPGVGMIYSLITLGDASEAQKTLSQVAHHLVLDRVYAHGRSTLDMRRCLGMNSAWTAVVDSWLSECHSNNGDSQAIWGSNGPGPFTIVNNHLAGAGENIMFGGDDSRAAELLPSDITIKRNHLVKPASWKGVWLVKNLFELKVGKRVLVEGNVMEGSWLSGQTGFAVIIKSTNQGGSAPWSTSQDVTMRFNRIARSASGFTIAGHPESYPVVPTTRVLLEHNLVEPLGSPELGGGGRLFMGTDDMTDVVIRHNTGFGLSAGYLFANGVNKGFIFNDNVANGGEYQWSFASADGHGAGANSLDFHAPGWQAVGNLFVHGGVNPRPANNHFVGSMAEAGFVNAGGPLYTSFTPGNYRLASSSPYKGKASDGSDPGVDHDRLNAALAGVVVAP